MYTCCKPNLACLHSLPVHVGLHTIIDCVQPTDGEPWSWTRTCAINSLTALERLNHNSNYNHTKHSPQKLWSHGCTTELTSKPTIQRKRHINVDCFGHFGTGAEMLPKCPTDTSAPVPKCLDAEVSVHPRNQQHNKGWCTAMSPKKFGERKFALWLYSRNSGTVYRQSAMSPKKFGDGGL